MKLKEFGANMHRYINAGDRIGCAVNITPEKNKLYSEYMTLTGDRLSLEHDLACLRSARKHLHDRGEIERVILKYEDDLIKVKLLLESEYRETPD